jgi:hypothetical protein
MNPVRPRTRTVRRHTIDGAQDSDQESPGSNEFDPDIVWWQGPADCGICGHQWQAVVPMRAPYAAPYVSLECPACGHRAGHPDD